MSSQAQQPPPPEFKLVRSAICGRGFSFGSEKELQEALSARLRAAFGQVEREMRLSPRDIVDFFLPQYGLGIEVKMKSGRSAVFRQLERYSRFPVIKSLLLVIPRVQQLPGELNGKPIGVIEIWPLII